MSEEGEAPVEATPTEPVTEQVLETPESPNQHAMEIGDVEDGELPEDGEIQDEESPGAASKASSGVNGVVASISTASHVSNTTTTTTLSEPREPIEHHPSPRPAYREISPDRRNGRRSRSPVRYGPPTIPARRRPAWTENVMCKFFREGYCRDGMDCSYSHNAALSNRKPELCKFYSQGFCKKGLACTLLHGEYPCKDFHQGRCTRNPCKYSHIPLNDYTQAIFDQIIQDERVAAQIKIPHQPTRRKTLLSRPPPSAPNSALSPPGRQESPPRKRPYPDDPMEALPYDAHSLPAAPRVVSDNYTAATAAEDPDELLVAGDDYRNQSDDAYRHQVEIRRSPPVVPVAAPMPAPAPAPAPGLLSIDDMLNQLARGPSPAEEAPVQRVVSNFDRNDTDIADTPASPDTRPEPVYKLYPLDQSPFNYHPNILKKLTSDRFRDDPRAAVIIQKQFDHDSLMIGQALPTVPPPQVEVIPAVSAPPPRDPRLRGAVPMDPRPARVTLRPSGGLLPTPAPMIPPSVNPVLPAATDYMADQHFQSLVEKQLQMVNQVKQNPEPEAPSASQYNTAPRSRYYDDDPHRGYNNDRGGYAGGHRDDYDSYRGRSRYNDDNYRGRPPRYSGPRGGYRGGYHDDDRYRSGPPRSSYSSERHDSTFVRSDGYRRDYRDRRDPYPPRHRDSRDSRYGGYRSRSRSPIRSSRDKDYDGYQSPETRA